MNVALTLPRPHAGQRLILDQRKKRNVLRCGRRFGKTQLGEHLLLETALEGLPSAWFAPTYKMLGEPWRDFLEMLAPFGSTLVVDKTDRSITLPTGGRIDFWSLDRDQVVRGRKYARAIVDEAAYVRDLERAWTASIRPTLTDYRGDAYFLSTPAEAHDYFNGTLYHRGEQDTEGWASWCMPTVANPFIDPDEVAEAEKEMPEAAFAQEYLGEPAEAASSPFGWEFIDAACTMDEPLGTPVDVWGVDLAKSVDWTVAVGLDREGNVAAFQRWQSDWRNTTKRLKAMVRGRRSLIDATGVGDPIVENISAGSPLVEGFKFTMSSRQSLLEGLAMALQRGELRLLSGVMESELRAFRYEYRSGRVRYAAPDGIHDDTVMALALAVRARQSRGAPVSIDVGPRLDLDDPDEWDD